MIRRVPLTRTGILFRRTRMPDRSVPLLPYRRRHAATGTRAVREDLNPAQRFVLWTRDGGRCICCGAPVPLDGFDASHRQRRGQGGNNTDFRNRCTMAPWCHRRGPLSPDLYPDAAGARGLHVAAWEDYADVPVTRWDGVRVLLTAAGGYLEAA